MCSGWWLVENEDKRLAWFPAPYLEKLEDGEDDEDDTMDSPTGIGALLWQFPLLTHNKVDILCISSALTAS